jgi:hypothetical protein
MDKVVFPETIKSKPNQNNAGQNATEQVWTIQVVRLRRHLRHVARWCENSGY